MTCKLWNNSIAITKEVWILSVCYPNCSECSSALFSREKGLY